jgi:hypothetical protein
VVPNRQGGAGGSLNWLAHEVPIVAAGVTTARVISIDDLAVRYGIKVSTWSAAVLPPAADPLAGALLLALLGTEHD